MSTLPSLGNLNKHQLEILKLFSRNMSDSDLIEIKKLVVEYLSKKVTKMADDICEKNNWSDEDMDRMLSDHRRTPYDSKN